MKETLEFDWNIMSHAWRCFVYVLAYGVFMMTNMACYAIYKFWNKPSKY